MFKDYLKFQSTPSAWRVTMPPMVIRWISKFQSTPSAWRVTICHRYTPPLLGISIHTLRMEGDVLPVSYVTPLSVFQSTPSAWRVTFCEVSFVQLVTLISIHTLRMEGDLVNPPGGYPHAPISIHTLRMEGDRQW